MGTQRWKWKDVNDKGGRAREFNEEEHEIKAEEAAGREGISTEGRSNHYT